MSSRVEENKSDSPDIGDDKHCEALSDNESDNDQRKESEQLCNSKLRLVRSFLLTNLIISDLWYFIYSQSSYTLYLEIKETVSYEYRRESKEISKLLGQIIPCLGLLEETEVAIIHKDLQNYYSSLAHKQPDERYEDLKPIRKGIINKLLTQIVKTQGNQDDKIKARQEVVDWAKKLMGDNKELQKIFEEELAKWQEEYDFLAIAEKNKNRQQKMERKVEKLRGVVSKETTQQIKMKEVEKHQDDLISNLKIIIHDIKVDLSKGGSAEDAKRKLHELLGKKGLNYDSLKFMLKPSTDSRNNAPIQKKSIGKEFAVW